MSEPARNRFALDLEDLERQLRGAAQPARAGQAPDPLAELTRIVGQDDPLKQLFAQRPQPQLQPSAPRAVPAATPPAELRGALDEFEALLRRTEPAGAQNPPQPQPQPEAPAQVRPDAEFEAMIAQAYQRPQPEALVSEAPRDLDQGREAYEYDYAEPAPDEPIAEPADPPRRSRRGLMTAAAMLAVGVVGVSVIFSLQPNTGASQGEPPLIAADRAPTKIVPVNPGGTEIPDQNKQIYDRAGTSPARPTTVVSREEQPVDVQQAARTLPPRVVLPGPGTGEGAAQINPLAQAPAVPAPERTIALVDPGLVPVPPVPGLGEPRRVRTVSIKPDGTPAPTPSATAAYANSAAPPMPVARAPAPPAPTTTASTPARPRPAPPAETAKVQDRATSGTPATTPSATPSAPLRLASAAPAAPTGGAAAAPRATAGDFTVQLAAPGSEAEARATFAALQRKYPDQLTGQAPIVRRTELAGGKTVYRLRVGPYSRDDATAMCSQLQSSGGQCFIARN